MSKVFSLKLVLILALSTSPLLADVSPEENQALKALCNYENANLSRFINPYFLSKLPTKKLIGILNEFKSEEGACVNIERIDQQNFLYNTEKSQRAVQLYFDKNKKIRGLWFGNATKFNDKLIVILDELKKLPGQKSLSLIKNNKSKILEFNSDKPLAVDSSSNLLTLKLLSDRIKKTKLRWGSHLKIKNKLKSLPSGRLHNWVEGSPLTVQTYATMMMAYSDNTAADHLHNLVGRKKLEKKSSRNKPFLSTYEYFKLRGELVEDYGSKKLKEKRKILKSYALGARTKIDMVDKPYQIDGLGWFFSTSELCSYFYELRNLPFIKVNSGLTFQDGWELSSFIGGRAPGVLQYTQLLKPKGSKDYYCLSITWNSDKEEIDSTKIDAFVGRIVSKIK